MFLSIFLEVGLEFQAIVVQEDALFGFNFLEFVEAHGGWEISHPRHNLVVWVGKEVAIPSSGECPKLFSQMAFIRNGMCRGLQHTCIPNQSISKYYSHTKKGVIYR